MSKRCFSTCLKLAFPKVPTRYNVVMLILFLLGNLSSIDKISACAEHFISLGLRLRELLIAMRTPPPFNLNLPGLSGSGG